MITLFFIDAYTPNENNGICTYRELLIDYFSKKDDIEVYVVFTLYVKCNKITTDTIGSITYIYLPNDLVYGRRANKFDIDFSKYMHSLSHGDKVVVFLNWMNHAYFSPIIKNEISNVKVILTKHCVCWRENVIKKYNLYHKIQNILQSHGIASVFIKRILGEELTYFSLVDHVIVVTDDAKTVLNRLYGIPKDCITRIYNGLGKLNAPSCSKLSLRQKYGLKKDDVIILYVGSLQICKGLNILYQVVEHLLDLGEFAGNIRLIVCGSGHFQEMMASMPERVVGHVTFMGNLPKNKLTELYSLADIGVQPSLNDQCSYVALEMMRANLPLVVSEIPGLREVMPLENAIFLPIRFDYNKYTVDLDIAAGHLHRIIKDQAFREEYVDLLSQNFQKRFNAEYMCENTYQTIKKLCERRDVEVSHVNTLISVVIPCYNAQQTIEQTLNSALTQVGVSIEVIVVDDCSNDNTVEIVKRIKDNRLRLIENTINKGIVHTLNIGIEAARGKYIARVDADDIMLPSRLYRQVSFLEANLDYAIVGGNIFLTDVNGYPIKCMCFPEKYDEIKWCIYLFNPFAHSAILVRKSILERFKYSDEYPYCEDYQLWYKILSKAKGYNLQEFVTNYQISLDSISGKNVYQQNENALLLSITECEKLLGRSLDKLEIKLLSAMHLGAPKGYWDKYYNQSREFIYNIAMATGVALDDAQLSIVMECFIARVI